MAETWFRLGRYATEDKVTAVEFERSTAETLFDSKGGRTAKSSYYGRYFATEREAWDEILRQAIRAIERTESELAAQRTLRSVAEDKLAGLDKGDAA